MVNDTLGIACSTAATSGDNVIIARPGAGKRIVLLSATIQNESSTAATWILYDGPSADGIALRRLLGQNQGDGIEKDWHAPHRPVLREDSALVLNLSGAYSHNYTIEYTVEDAH